MPLYKRPEAPEETLTDEEALVEEARRNPNAELSPLDKNWQKRYGDLKSYSDKQANGFKSQMDTLNRRIAELEGALKDNTQMPTTAAELTEWMEKYPQVGNIMRTIAMQEARSETEKLNGLKSEVEDMKKTTAQEKAQLELEKRHPDFFTTIAKDQAFWDWLEKKSKRMQDSIQENDLDHEWAAETLDAYKLETGYGARKRPARDAKADARGINTRDVPSLGTGGGRSFKESEIMAMHPKQYEQMEAEIDAARAAGRLIMDVTDSREAARG